MSELFVDSRYAEVHARTPGGADIVEVDLTVEEAIAMLRGDTGHDIYGTAYIALAERLELCGEEGRSIGKAEFELSPVGASLTSGLQVQSQPADDGLQRLQRHNAQMAMLLHVMADALQGPGVFWDAVTDHLGIQRHESASTAIRNLAGGRP